MKLRPIAGLQPTDATAAAKLASPPYDVVTTESARALIKKGKSQFLRVVRPDATLEASSAADEDATHAAAASALAALEEDSLLARAKPGVFVYELRDVRGRAQRGIAALASIEDYAAALIRPHEATRRAKEDERAALADALGAHTGPVLLAHAPDSSLAALIVEAGAGPPLFAVRTANGAEHRLWRASDALAERLLKAFERVSCAYIADGHHRAAGAARVGFDRRSAGGTQMDRESDWFPAVLFPANQMRSLPYYRLVEPVEGVPAASAFDRLDPRAVRVERLQSRPAKDAHRGVVYAATREGADVVWRALHFANADSSKHALDCQQLQDKVLEPAFKIGDPRTDDRIDFVGGINLIELDALVKQRGCIGFAPGAVSMETVMEVVDRGSLMPPKSTWFEPKLASGLFVHTF